MTMNRIAKLGAIAFVAFAAAALIVFSTPRSLITYVASWFIGIAFCMVLIAWLEIEGIRRDAIFSFADWGVLVAFISAFTIIVAVL